MAPPPVDSAAKVGYSSSMKRMPFADFVPSALDAPAFAGVTFSPSVPSFDTSPAEAFVFFLFFPAS